MSVTGKGAVSTMVTVQDPALHVIYVADCGNGTVKTYVYPSAILAYDQNGVAQTLSGPFTNVNASNQPQGIAADPATGNVYVLTNTGYLFAYDANGNSLFTVTGLGDPFGITTAPPP